MVQTDLDYKSKRGSPEPAERLLVARFAGAFLGAAALVSGVAFAVADVFLAGAAGLIVGLAAGLASTFGAAAFKAATFGANAL